jgi:Asp/Glu/hydantoin racemase
MALTRFCFFFPLPMQHSIHIKVINGNTFDAMTQGINESAQAARFPNTTIGIAEASMYVANMVAARWGVVTTQHRTLDMIEKTILLPKLTSHLPMLHLKHNAQNSCFQGLAS